MLMGKMPFDLKSNGKEGSRKRTKIKIIKPATFAVIKFMAACLIYDTKKRHSIENLMHEDFLLLSDDDDTFMVLPGD